MECIGSKQIERIYYKRMWIVKITATFFPSAIAAISFEKFELNMKDF